MISTGRSVYRDRQNKNNMKNRKLFLLLDIDGVLLEAQGYRCACVDTINDFLKKMGQPYLSVDRSVADFFESSGISTEWDMVPLTLAAFVNWYCSKTKEQLPNVFPPDCSNTVFTDNEEFKKMLFEQISQYAEMLDPDQTCINAIYQKLQDSDGIALEFLWKLPIRDHFFVDTLNPIKAPFFAGLMNRLLGSDTFRNFYGIDAPFVCESYLETKDTPLISEKNRELLPSFAGSDIYPVIMTYRPSKFPAGSGNKPKNYFVNTPEGECALKLLGWDDGRVRMIGAGSLCYIEEKYGLRREYYVKPHPFHAVASVMMAVCGNEIQSLELSRLLCELDPEQSESPVTQWFHPDDEIVFAVFEDSVSGIKSVRAAAEVFKKWGYNVTAQLCGIRSTERKNKLLSDVRGVVLFDQINDALASVLADYRGKETNR